MDAQITGKFIGLLRKEKGMTQATLADKLNISNRTVSKWENGDGFPDITILPELAEILGVTVDELLKGEKGDNTVVFTEIKNRDNLNNFYQITYVVSLFAAIFSALLGGITELYCIWAFEILFYTHWEIIFAAISLFSVIFSGLIFSIGLTRLHISYSYHDIIAKAKKKIFVLSFILSVFPATFIMRIINVFLPTKIALIIAIAFAVALVTVFYVIYQKKVRCDKK